MANVTRWVNVKVMRRQGSGALPAACSSHFIKAEVKPEKEFHLPTLLFFFHPQSVSHVSRQAFTRNTSCASYRWNAPDVQQYPLILGTFNYCKVHPLLTQAFTFSIISIEKHWDSHNVLKITVHNAKHWLEGSIAQGWAVGLCGSSDCSPPQVPDLMLWRLNAVQSSQQCF